MLKRLAVHAVRSFNAEVKAGKRNGLTEDELRDLPPPGEEEDEKPTIKSKAKGKGGRDTGVKQAKIVRQQERVDPVTGKGRSKGYGFLEMVKHGDALRVLRWANNNPEVGRLFGEWWKEELGDLIKLEKKAKKEDGRLERLKSELEHGAALLKKSRGTLILEFSIENVQVVKRRATHQQEQRATASDPKKSDRRASVVDVKREDEEERPRKKRRAPDLRSDSKTKPKPEEADKGVGAMIGRKRKERKGKKGKS